MADEIAQVVDLEYKGIYYLLKGTKAMITSMVSAIKALHTWQHKKWLEKPGSCSWQKIQEASEGMAPILEFPAEMFEKTIDITNDKSIKGEGFISPFEYYCRQNGLRYCIIRSLNANYERLLLERKPEEKKYQYCMISRGGIKGLLPCSLRYIDGEAYLYYDITSRQNIAQLFEKKPITRQWIMDFLWSMRRVRQEMSRFLLEESNIVWFPQHVYQDLEKKEFYFIYVPYCTENTGFDELMEYLVEHVDYQDESLVEYVYKAYEQYESAGEVYLQAKIFEDAECLRIPEKMDAVEEETTVVVGQDQEKDAIREEEKEMPVGEVTVIKEKKGLFNLWENRKKKEKQERDNYTRSLQLTMTGYAVAEENAYEEEDMGRTVYMEERPAPRESTHRLLSEEGKLLATLEQPIYTIGKKRGETDLVLNDQSISRLHARIIKETDGYYLEDMNSTNGTFKNGLQLQPYERRKLEEGDEITLGKITVIYR